MQLHYQSVGQGQPLILIHGLFGFGGNWGNIAKYFSQHFQVISVDLRNHGRSPHSDSQSYTEMAADIAELCDTLNLNKINLLGHSIGGKVAMQFATQHPERMQHLVIVDIAMRAYADAHTQLIDAMLAVDFTAMQSRTEVDKALSSSVKETMVRQFLLMNLVKLANGLAWRINLPALKANYPALQKSVCNDVQYELPCLFIRGEHSPYIQDADVKQIKQHFIHAQFSSLPTNHWVHAEQPKAFSEVVAQFLLNVS